MDCLTNCSLNCTTINSKLSWQQYSGISSWILTRFRRLFYLSDPGEETFEFVHQVKDYHGEAFPFFTSLILLEWLIFWLKGRSLPLLAESTACIGTVMFTETARLITRGTQHSLYVYIYDNYRLIDLPWNSVFTWYLAAIFVDFCAYWAHRASHEINFLWAFHQGHHNSEHFSLVNSFRLEHNYDWKYAAFYLPMAFIIPPSHYLVHLQLCLFYQFWIHSGLIKTLGPLEWIFNTPSHHRVHHSRNKRYLDKNYAACLIIWDKLFGTFQAELPEDEPLFGLVEQVDSYNPVYIQYFYFGKMYDKWQSMIGWKDKLYSLIKGPGWRPGSPWTGYIDDVPEAKPRRLFQVPVSSFLVLYQVVNFLIILLAYEGIILSKEKMSNVSLVCHLFYVLVSVTSVGLFFDGNRFTAHFEFLRCVFSTCFSFASLPLLTNSFGSLGLISIYGPRFPHQIVLLLRFYYFLSSLIWGILLTIQIRIHASMVKKLN